MPIKDTTSDSTLELLLQQSNLNQHQLKRLREWVYLTHFLAISKLHPTKTISGSDDGQEPDFTCIFLKDDKPYYVGIELTTLPRLRDRLGNDNLMARRWYWQTLLQMNTHFKPTNTSQKPIPSVTPYSDKGFADAVINPHEPLLHKGLQKGGQQLQKLISKTMRWLPSAFFTDMADAVTLPIDSLVTQADIDAAMAKKAHKVTSYQQRRHLDEIWLLIHTNEQQENGVLQFLHDQTFTHHSDFDQVFVTFYPSDMLLSIQADRNN